MKQHVATEPEAKLMRTAGGGHAVSYNVQTAVDAKYKLIVTHEVTNEGNDQRRLSPTARAVKQALGLKRLTVVADVGYQNGEQGAECEADGIIAVVPSQRPVNPCGQFFDKSRFIYEPEHNQYRCPAGAVLRVYKTDRKLKLRYYSTPACEICALRP
ncbi:MAG: IS5/IS1182 family transposase, partial [Gammaproteobacteria bacterium]|nr:IS5/IS1182 family transposase [Gammaproteobacteria bacterium]NIP76250.1 IS5/IS1182 family transposase [Xanthomonadales bacterium]